MSIRAVLAGVAVGLVAAMLYFLPRTPPPAPLPAVEAPAPVVVADAAPPPEIALDEPDEPDASSFAAGVSFADGFCSESGGDTIHLRFSLEKSLSRELLRRVGSDAGAVGPESELLLELAHGAKPAALLERARSLAAELPDSPYPRMVLAIALGALGQTDDRLAELRRLRRQLPDDPAIAFALADATRDGAELDEPIDALTVYLRSDPAPAVSRLRARLEVQRDIQRDYRRQTHDGITVAWPAEVMTDQQADELGRAVDRGLDDAAAFTGTRRRAQLTVVVYPSRSELLAVSCVRSWTAALFDGVLRTVAAPAFGGVDLKVLRHETLHAQLSPLAPAAPKWFHEGVAQSFAQERAPKRVWRQMLANRVWVPFSSLDGSFQVFNSNADADLAYAQSYAMVELMRERSGDRAISSALGAFLAGADTPTALARACGEPEVTGDELLRSIDRRLQAAP